MTYQNTLFIKGIYYSLQSGDINDILLCFSQSLRNAFTLWVTKFSHMMQPLYSQKLWVPYPNFNLFHPQFPALEDFLWETRDEKVND
jgi:hypothetical protein